MRQAVDCTQQTVPDSVDVQFIAPYERHEVSVSEFEQLDEPMLDLDIAVGAGFAQARGVGEGVCAMLVQAAQEQGEVSGDHGRR